MSGPLDTSKTLEQASISELEEAVHIKLRAANLADLARMDSVIAELDDIAKRRMFLKREYQTLQFPQDKCPNRRYHGEGFGAGCKYCKPADGNI